MRIKKIVKILICVILTIISLTTIVNATIDVNSFKKPGSLKEEDYEKTFAFAGTILNTIVTVGVVISVLGVIFLGIKYMAGSVEERAEYKKTMMPMLIGMIMLFCTTTVVSIIWNIVSKM